MSHSDPVRVHVVTGGFPAGQTAGHDMDYARLRLLQLLQERQEVHATVANDFQVLNIVADRRLDLNRQADRLAGAGLENVTG